MEKIKSIINNKVFLTILSFALTVLTLKFVGEIGWVFMLYPLIILFTGMLYGFILNPLRERRELKRYLSYKGTVTGTVKYEGNPIFTAKVVISNPLDNFDIDASNYFTVTDINGRFEIPHVKNGDLICKAYKNGYEYYSQEFKMENYKPVNIEINLIKKKD